MVRHVRVETCDRVYPFHVCFLFLICSHEGKREYDYRESRDYIGRRVVTLRLELDDNTDSDKESAPSYREITENEVHRNVGHGSKIR